jgi:CheY-like chemotaxis protein
MNSSNYNPSILILEDDPDQIRLLIDFAQSEIKKLMSDKNTNDRQKQKLKNIGLIKVSNINSLRKAASTHKNVLLAILDCNTPDKKGGAAHDQLLKTNHIVTGQHKSVDIVTEHLPDTPITLISSLNRFQRTVNRYYESKHDLSINFISKNDPSKLKKDIEKCLKKYLQALD